MAPKKKGSKAGPKKAAKKANDMGDDQFDKLMKETQEENRRLYGEPPQLPEDNAKESVPTPLREPKLTSKSSTSMASSSEKKTVLPQEVETAFNRDYIQDTIKRLEAQQCGERGQYIDTTSFQALNAAAAKATRDGASAITIARVGTTIYVTPIYGSSSQDVEMKDAPPLDSGEYSDVPVHTPAGTSMSDSPVKRRIKEQSDRQPKAVLRDETSFKNATNLFGILDNDESPAQPTPSRHARSDSDSVTALRRRLERELHESALNHPVVALDANLTWDDPRDSSWSIEVRHPCAWELELTSSRHLIAINERFEDVWMEEF